MLHFIACILHTTALENVCVPWQKFSLNYFHKKLINSWPTKIWYMLYTKSRSLQDCHSGSRTATTVPVHIAEISLDITKSSSLGVRQSDLSYKTVTAFTVDYRMWDRIYKNPVWFHIHLWSEFTTWDFEFLQAWYSYCTWCSILSLYFSRTMLKYDQNVPLNKVICTEATNTLGGSATSRIQSILIDSGVYGPPRWEVLEWDIILFIISLNCPQYW